MSSNSPNPNSNASPAVLRAHAEVQARFERQFAEVRERLVDYALKLAEQDRAAQAAAPAQKVP